MYARLTSRQMKAAKSLLNVQLNDWAARLGLTDGCKFYVVEPAVRNTDDDIEFRQHSWWGFLVAPISARCPNVELWNALGEKTIYPTDYPSDERLVLQTGPMRQILTEVLGWPSLCLYDPWQWWHYHAQTLRQPLYVPFGRWRELLAEQKRPDPFVQPPPRVMALRNGNRLRNKTARVELDRLVAIARPLWEQIQANAGSSRRGRPAHRCRLRELLAEQGIEISDWCLRQLTAELRKSDKGGGV
jgi:hypothetical protein